MLDNTKTYPANVDFIPRILDDVRILTIANNGPKLHSIFITLFLSLSLFSPSILFYYGMCFASYPCKII